MCVIANQKKEVATTAKQGGNNNYGKFEALINNSKASEYATELGFITSKEREDYFFLIYLQNLPVTDYKAFKSFRMRLAWEISEIAGGKEGNQSTVWNVVTALNTLREKGNWVEEGNTFRGSMNDLVLHSLHSNIKAQVENVIEMFGWEKGFEEVVKEIVFTLNFGNPYAA